MKSKHLLPLFLLIIAGTQAIRTSEYNTNFTSKDKGLIQSNGQAHELLGSSSSQTSKTGKCYGSIEESTRIMMNEKDDESTTNEHKHEVSISLRKAKGGSAGRGARGSRGIRGVYGGGGSGANVNHKPSRFKSSAPSSFSLPWPNSFWTSTFILCVSFDLFIWFPLYY